MRTVGFRTKEAERLATLLKQTANKVSLVSLQAYSANGKVLPEHAKLVKRLAVLWEAIESVESVL